MNRIEEQARYFRNIPLRDRSIKAVVHLEDAEDKLFWNNQLQKAFSGKYLFIPYSKNQKGNDVHGCEQCLRYKAYLTKTFFICIDSDLRQLKGEEGLTAESLIAQTYAYSWENHFCEAEHLQERFEELVPNSDFDFQVFLRKLSAVIYKPLLYLVQYSQSSELNQQWNITRFNSCLPLQPSRDELADNGSAYIERVKLLFEAALQNLQQPENMVNEHLDDANAYLHIQGHQLYKLVLHIGTMLCKRTRVAFKTDILDKSLHTDGYLEINSVQADLSKITSKE
ncbi:MAG: DUF4435 domain-containing protein [Bacteroidaceae bacterium]|nr:DUF4435 domain-containing protein [Bacteroidaceae bacterium]